MISLDVKNQSSLVGSLVCGSKSLPLEEEEYSSTFLRLFVF